MTPHDTPPKHLAHPMLAWSRRLLWLGVATALAALIFAYLWPATTRYEPHALRAVSYGAFLLRTFTFQIGLGIAILALTALLCRARRLGVIASVLAAAVLAPTLATYAPPRGAPAGRTPMLTVYSANVLVGRADVRTIAAQARAEDADLVLIQEATPPFAATLRAELAGEYPYIEEASRNGAYGQMTLSRLPFESTPEHYPQGELAERFAVRPGINPADPQVRVAVRFGGREVVIQNIHLTSPGGVEAVAEQLEQARWLAAWLAQEDRPALMLGDFNCTPSSAHAGMLRHAGWADAFLDAGAGRCATWPNTGWLAWVPRPLGVRIDHAYSGNGVRAVGARVLGRDGSDHRPIVARFVLD